MHDFVFRRNETREGRLRYYIKKLVTRHTLDILSELESLNDLVVLVVPEQHAVASIFGSSLSTRNKQDEIRDADHLNRAKAVVQYPLHSEVERVQRVYFEAYVSSDCDGVLTLIERYLVDCFLFRRIIRFC